MANDTTQRRKNKNLVMESLGNIINFYKEREMKLAQELVEKYGYHSGDFARIQGADRRAAYSYYKPILKKAQSKNGGSK